MPIDAEHFISVLRPVLERGCAQTAAQVIGQRWNPSEVCSLLAHEDVDVRRVAAIAVGFVGGSDCVECLVSALHDADEQVNAMAEHSLWAVWFRSCKAEAVAPFQDGLSCLAEERYRDAVPCFQQALAADPDFAEAWHQCAIAHFFMTEYEAAIADGHRALEHMPVHFGALAGIGHAHAHQFQFEQALCHYRKALEINPHMPAIAAAAERIETRLSEI